LSSNSTVAVCLGLILALGVVAIFLLLQWRNRREANLRRSGLSALRGLQSLLAYVQQHRGLANGFLRGEATIEPALIETRNKVHAQIELIEATSDWMLDAESWRNVTESWAKIVASFPYVEAEKSFLIHCQLVRNILDLIAHTAKHHRLIAYSDSTGRAYAYLWQQLLNTAELLGQARALGIGVVVENNCSVKTRKQIEKLVSEIEREIDLLHKHMPDHSRVCLPIRDFLNTIDNQILQQSQTIAAMTYFDIASAAINSLYEHYNENMRLLADNIFRR